MTFVSFPTAPWVALHSSAGFKEYSELQQLGEALDPWVVGCFGPEKDAEEIAESKQICERLLLAHKL